MARCASDRAGKGLPCPPDPQSRGQLVLPFRGLDSEPESVGVRWSSAGLLDVLLPNEDAPAHRARAPTLGTPEFCRSIQSIREESTCLHTQACDAHQCRYGKPLPAPLPSATALQSTSQEWS